MQSVRSSSEPARVRRALSIGLLLASVLCVAVPPAATAGATGTILFSNITGGPSTSGPSNVTAQPSPDWRYAQKFVPTQSGVANIVSIWGQCVVGFCPGTGTLRLYTDSSGHPGTPLGANAVGFSAPVSLGGSPMCAPMSNPPTLTQGVAYWAVLTATSQYVAWNFQSDVAGGPLESTDLGATWHANRDNKTLSLEISSATDCTPHAVPNPDAGSTLAPIITKSGQKAFDTITIGNDGEASLNLLGGGFGGANPSVFTVLQSSQIEGPLAQAYRFPQPIAADGVTIMYIVCAGPATEGLYQATFTVTTDDPTQPTISWNVQCLVDNTPPTISFSSTPTGQDGWWITTPAITSILTQDPESGGLVKNVTCT